MNVGLILPHVGPSQLAYYGINQCVIAQEHTPFDYFVCFREEQPPCMPIRLACMNISELYGFNGIVISTDLESSSMMLSAINNTLKFFYVWDLEWLRPNKSNFLSNMNIYRNPNLELIAQSEDHAKAIENYCNRKPKLVVQNLNLTEIINAINSNQS